MNGDPDRLEDLARRVTDGTPIDWEAAEHAAETPDDRATIRGLRLLARIAEAVPGGDAAGTWGPLELLERIAEGSFGQVWRARDTRLDREVALKLFPEEVSRRRDVLEEGRMLARVRHPNVVTVYGAEIHAGRVGIWMELVKGVTLEERLREQGPLGPDEALLVGIDLCRALAAVHAVGLVHGDVKAANVLREEGGRIVLADFGAGSRSGPGPASETVAGTPLYLAPELLRGGERTPSVDLYATGVLLAHLATGGYPVSATSLEELIAKHGRGERASLRDLRPDLPDGFVAVVERATAHEPSGRFPSAGAMERALRESLGAGLRLRRRRALGWTLGAVVGLAVLGWSASFRGGMSVDADWVRVRDDGTRETLREGSRVAPGDRLGLEIESDRDVFVYVVNEDERGHAFVLFPLPGLDLANPLPGGRPHRLPGSERGHARYWGVDTAGGREHFLVVASATRAEAFEAALASLPHPDSRSGALELDRPARDALLRGVGAVVEGPLPGLGASATPLFEMARRLDRAPGAGREVEVLRFTLENPAGNPGP